MKNNLWVISKLITVMGMGFSLLVGCAGPTSPFGALNYMTGDGETFESADENAQENLSVSPSRQVLHKSSPLKIEYNSKDALKKDTRLYVTYNKRNVTNAFKQKSQLGDVNNKQFAFIYPNLRLKADRRHQIDVYVKSNQNILSHIRYLPPECSIETSRAIASIEPFRPEENYINAINNSANQHKINPTFLAGLIAQESGFDSELVSHAKAVGLTQVTPLADTELKKLRPEWRRDNRIEILNYMEIESLVQQKKISNKQDWRLEPRLAIEGGALYLNYLREYWQSTENKTLLEANPKVNPNEVILASYNSGASRIKSKIQKNGATWLDDEELKEAFKYVQSVQSYCYHFSERTK